MRHLSRLLAVTLLLTIGHGPAEARRKKVRIYIVQPGDSCWSIAQRFFGKGLRYDIIHRYNRLGPLPHLLTPGQRIRLPLGAGGSDARVNWLRRDVKAKSPRATDWRRAKRNMELWKLYRVTTGNDSSAGIRFVDQSHLYMRQKALLVIYGGSAPQSRGKRRVKTTVVLKRGTIKGGLARLDREAGLVVRTPSGRVTLKSKLSQVEVDQLKTSIISVYHGVADVLAKGFKVIVPTNHGTYVKRGRRPAKPIPLPAPPRWEGSTGDAVVLVPHGHKGGFEARWKNAPRARRFRVEVARDARFNQILVDAVVGAGIRRFQAKALGLGTYWARVASIDRYKLEGRPSAAIRVKVLPLRASRRLVRSPKGDYLAVGLLRLDLRKQHGVVVEASVDGGAFFPATEPVRLSKPGHHLIRYRLKGRKIVSKIAVRILAVTARISGHESGIKVGGAHSFRPLPLNIQLKDERGRPAVLPGLALRAVPGGTIPLVPDGAGRYTASLSPPLRYPGKSVRLTLSWAAGVVATADIVVTSPPPTRRPVHPAPVIKKRAAAPPPIFWPMAPAAFEWSRPGPGLPSRSARPSTYSGISSLVADRDAGAGDREVAVRMALRGGLTLWQGRVGLDADLPWFASDITRDETGYSDLGDLRFGARLVAWHGLDMTVTPSLRLTAPTAGYPSSRRVLSFEPGLLFEWRLSRLLTIGTNQVLVADADLRRDERADSSLFYASAYYINVRPLTWLSATAELGVAVALAGPPDLVRTMPISLGGTLWFHPGRIRVGVTAAAGVTDDARRLLGQYTVGLSLDLAYRGL